MAGPSLKETLGGLLDCAKALDEIITKANGSSPLGNLLRDAKRLDFGVRMTEFIYLMCLSALGKENNLDKLRRIAENLEADTDSMAGYDFGSNMENALNASWMAKTYYERFSESGNSKIKSNGIAL